MPSSVFYKFWIKMERDITGRLDVFLYASNKHLTINMYYPNYQSAKKAMKFFQYHKQIEFNWGDIVEEVDKLWRSGVYW